MMIKIYTDQEKTEVLYDMPLADYLIMVNNEMFDGHWRVIENGDVEIRKEP